MRGNKSMNTQKAALDQGPFNPEILLPFELRLDDNREVAGIAFDADARISHRLGCSEVRP